MSPLLELVTGALRLVRWGGVAQCRSALSLEDCRRLMESNPSRDLHIATANGRTVYVATRRVWHGRVYANERIELFPQGSGTLIRLRPGTNSAIVVFLSLGAFLLGAFAFALRQNPLGLIFPAVWVLTAVRIWFVVWHDTSWIRRAVCSLVNVRSGTESP